MTSPATKEAQVYRLDLDVDELAVLAALSIILEGPPEIPMLAIAIKQKEYQSVQKKIGLLAKSVMGAPQ